MFKAKSFQLVLGISLLFVANRSLRSQDASTKGNAPKTPPVRTSASPSAEVALTFDDLPSHGPLPQGLSRIDIAKSIIGALKAAQAPPIYGFVNAKRIADDASSEQVLQLWRDAGFPLSSHTYSHIGANANSAEAFEQDLLADEPILKKYMDGQDWHWLRFPFLQEGDTVEKHRALETLVKNHGYRVAEVSLSFGDYGYNEPYARCLSKNDQQGIETLKKSYLDGAVDSLVVGQKMSQMVYGRDIKHIMLLHIGGFETIMLPKLLELLKDKNFKLITLQEAESDPAYATDAPLDGNWGGTFLQQMMRVKHLEFPPVEDRLSKLDAVCH